MPNPNDVEYRSAFEMRAQEVSERMILEGRAIVFNRPTQIGRMEGRDLFEVIDPLALEGCDMEDCCLKHNHSWDNLILARVRGGSLSIQVGAEGVDFRAELYNTTFSRDVYELVRQGALQCSFGFIIAPGGAVFDPDTMTRRINRIAKLVDLSTVDVPAYRETFVEARSMCETELAKAVEQDRRRREVYAKLMI